mmetsp:Transcript_5661/g.14175  ORF Transcript_5661/g.14175 Transcript_5661/m.14175 type:complete len:209 (-) Transcript_5661:776-1402(-)
MGLLRRGIVESPHWMGRQPPSYISSSSRLLLFPRRVVEMCRHAYIWTMMFARYFRGGALIIVVPSLRKRQVEGMYGIPDRLVDDIAERGAASAPIRLLCQVFMGEFAHGQVAAPMPPLSLLRGMLRIICVLITRRGVRHGVVDNVAHGVAAPGPTRCGGLLCHRRSRLTDGMLADGIAGDGFEIALATVVVAFGFGTMWLPIVAMLRM